MEKPGDSYPIGKSRRVVYKGKDENFLGKTALMCEARDGGFCFQFDDMHLVIDECMYGFGWWEMPRKDFKLIK